MINQSQLTKTYQNGKSIIFSFQFYDGDEPSADTRLLWSVYQEQPFLIFDPGLDWSEFIERLKEYSDNIDLLLATREKEKNHRDLIAIIILEHDEWRYEPHVVFFDWASDVDKLRGTKAFFEMMTESDEIGICEVFSHKETTSLFNKVCEYGNLKPAGKRTLANGRPDEYLYVTYGKKPRPDNYKGTLYTQGSSKEMHS